MPSPTAVFCGTYRDITAALAERITRERADLLESLQSPLEILIPSRGVADAIVGELMKSFPDGIAGIRLQTPETLALRILNQGGRYPRIASAADRRLAMLLAAGGISNERLNTPGMAAMLERSYRDIRDSGVTLGNFRRKRESFSDPKRTGELIEAWRRYETLLARCGAIDPADGFHQAVEILGSEFPLAPQIVFGFYDMTGIQEIFLGALHRAGKVDSIYVPVRLDDPAYGFASRHLEEVRKLGAVPALSERSESNGCRVPGTGSDRAQSSIRNYPTPAEEAREVCREIRALLDSGTDSRRIGMVARTLEPQRIALLQRAASEFDVPISKPAARPLASHPFGHTLRLLLEVREHRFPRAMVVELGGSPLRTDFWGFSFNPERLDSATRRAEIAGGPSTWVKASLPRIESEHPHSLEHITNYLRLLHRLEQFTEPLATHRRGARWADTLESVADALYAESEEDLLALAALHELAALCRRVDPCGAAFDAATILHLIDSAGELGPRKISGPAVWVGDVMKARGRRFEHLFVMDLRDGAFPQSRAEDPLVSNADRKIAAVRQIGDGRDEEKLLFQLLLDAADGAIHFSYPSSDGVRRVFNPSPFLKDFAPGPESRVPGPGSRVEKRIAALATSPLGVALGRRLDLIRFAGTRSRYDSYLSISESFVRALDQKLSLISPSSLEHYGQCPQRFLFTALLGVGEIEDPEYELQISLRKKGGLDHRILESFYSSLSDADFSGPIEGRLPDHLQKRLEETIDEQFRRHEFEYPAPNQMIREVERKLTRRFLSEFVREDLRDLAETGFRPRHFEYQFGPGRGDKEPDHDPVTIRLGSRQVTLRGKIDRVDRSLSGEHYQVLDYKSGKGVKYKNLADLTETGRALQLGFYALAACEIFGVRPEKMHAAIRPLRHGEPDDRLAFNLSEVVQSLSATLARLAESMSAGYFPAFPGKHCEYCAVGRWCRANNDPHEKRALSRFDSALELLESAECRVPSAESESS